MTDREQIGGNNPPSPIDYAREVIGDLSKWMADNPVIADEKTARAAKLLVDRAVAALREVEQERQSKVKPLNDEVSSINAAYKAVHDAGARKGKAGGTFDRVLEELRQRISSFMLIEEAQRQRALEEKRRAAEAARQAALEAEAKEREALANAAVGEADIDIAAVTQEADNAFAAFQSADRGAAIAEKDSTVRLGGGFARAMTLRNVETLVVTDPFKALRVIGVTDKVKEAILTGARAFRQEYGELPDGVEARFERRS